ncbi:MAG: porin family protein [Bdellovibrionales bacterium]|nr:porin family protein [Bdellovibrionales bacterium]
MKFTMIVAVIATLSMAAQAQNAQPTVVLIPASQVQTQQPAVQAQPATVVEAAPVSESKADVMRKARQNQELQTEQKIVEKLEESRLKEEQQRAERLFGDKLNDSAPAATVAPVAQPVAPAPQPVQPQQVTIEKIEIVQPATPVVEEKPAVVAEPVTESKLDVSEEQESVFARKFFVGGVLAAPSYSAANLKTNYGVGVTVGTQLDPNWAIEGMFLYSNHVVDTFWDYNLYRDMDQYDFQASAKYYILTGKLKPYLGASASYVLRQYTERLKNNSFYSYAQDKSESADTHSVNVGLVAGVDFEVSDSITLGAGIDYNTPVMKKHDFNFRNYNLPENTKPVEEFDYTTIKVNARMTF